MTRARRCTTSACSCRSAASPRRRCAASPTWPSATATATSASRSGQNLIIPNIPENAHRRPDRRAALQGTALRPVADHARPGLPAPASTTAAMALIETKGYAIEVAQELERRTAGRKLLPLTIHWSGCPASCGMHQVATIGLQGCRSRVNGAGRGCRPRLRQGQDRARTRWSRPT